MNVRELRAGLFERLSHGQHLILYGPRGSGKSTPATQLHARFLRTGIPCALAPSTSGLNDITRTMEAAYPQVNTQAVSRRTARYRLWSAADRRRCVLLLDHLTEVSTAMVGFLRRLRGGVAGVLFIVDVDVERERMRMRKRAKSLALSVRMPTAGLQQSRAKACAELGMILSKRSDRPSVEVDGGMVELLPHQWAAVGAEDVEQLYHAASVYVTPYGPSDSSRRATTWRARPHSENKASPAPTP
jgi:thymidylate kinase